MSSIRPAGRNKSTTSAHIWPNGLRLIDWSPIYLPVGGLVGIILKEVASEAMRKAINELCPEMQSSSIFGANVDD